MPLQLYTKKGKKLVTLFSELDWAIFFYRCTRQLWHQKSKSHWRLQFLCDTENDFEIYRKLRFQPSETTQKIKELTINTKTSIINRANLWIGLLRLSAILELVIWGHQIPFRAQQWETIKRWNKQRLHLLQSCSSAPSTQSLSPSQT